MSRIGHYWKRTQKTMTWKIAFRCRKTNIIKDTQTPFSIFEQDKGLWGADPFIVDKDGKSFLFYELFIEKENKGVIAVSEYDGKNFKNPQIIIKEPFHLSFPCVFEINGIWYMIPETGSQHNLILYECTNFPNEWLFKKVLINNFDSSDTIVYSTSDTIFVIASQLVGSTCNARNVLFKLDPSRLVLEEVEIGDNVSEIGIRNAGLIFQNDNQIIRPGQNCSNGDYGKSLIFWEVDQNNLLVENNQLEIKVNELNFPNKNIYNGIHTYNLSSSLEVVDIRMITKTPLKTRVYLFRKLIIDYLKLKLS